MIRTTALVLSGFPDSAKNLVFFRRLRQNREAAAIWAEYFDGTEYLTSYPDVASSGLDPAIHYLLRGNAEQRNPSRKFSTGEYLGRYPDVGKSKVNALLHYAFFGRREGRVVRSSGRQSDQAAVGSFELGLAKGTVLQTAVTRINNEWPIHNPLVSVVIPCFNYGQFIEETVCSAIRQTFEDLEVIVVEGGSTDGSTPDQVRKLEAQDLPKVRFFYRTGQHLVGDNRNFGIGMARGRYICCLDADDILCPVYIETAVFLAETMGYDFVYPSVRCFGDSDLIWAVQDASFPEILNANQVSTVALFRRSAWAHAGGFRDWGLGSEYVYEDWDFWIRLLGHGFQGKSIREPLLLYRNHPTGITSTTKPDMNEQRARLAHANAALQDSFQERSRERMVVNPASNLSRRTGPPALLIALPFITIGGGEKLFRSISESIAAQGMRVIVVTSLTLSEAVPDDSKSFESITPRVYHLSRLFDCDSVRAHFVRYLIQCYDVRTLMLAGSEFVYHLLPDLRTSFPRLRVVDQLFNEVVHVPNNRRFASVIDATIVPSERLRNHLVEKERADPATVHVIPHGVRVPEVSGSTPDPLPPGFARKIVIGCFGRLSSEKAPDSFVEIAHALASDDRLAFVMTGEGPEAEAVRKLVRKHRLTERIYMPGFVEDPLPLLRRADIVVLPSRIDGMPLIVLEAQALGKPVVASKVGSIPEMISHGESGILCDPANIGQFCAAIRKLAGDESLREAMGRAGRKFVIERYGVEQMMARYRSVFRIEAPCAAALRASAASATVTDAL